MQLREAWWVRSIGHVRTALSEGGGGDCVRAFACRVVRHLMRGELPVVLPMCLDVTDVRDVARAHVHVLEHPQASGRYLVAHSDAHYLTYSDAAASLRRAFPAFPIASFVAPAWMLHLVAKVDKRLDQYAVDYSLTQCPGLRFDGSRLTRELSFV
jgi:nucleoside-diphosphate-sugar epimerase